MHNLIMKIRKAIQIIEKEKGEFKIKSLVAKDPANIQWDLILSAEWFDSNPMNRLNYLHEKILSDFDIDCMIQFSSIITYGANESSPLLQTLEAIQNNLSSGKYDLLGNDFVIIETNQLENCKLAVPLNA